MRFVRQKFRTRQTAPWAHPAAFILIGAGVVAFGLFAQHAPSGAGGAASGQLAGHSSAIPVYLSAIFMDWALFYLC